MQMTEGEIIASFRQAKEPEKQIRVLAELNDCEIGVIKDIIINDGVLESGGAKPDSTLSTSVETGCTPTVTENEKPGKRSESKIEIDYEKVKELYEQGLSDKRIAKAVGVKSASTIVKWRQQNNLPSQTARSRETGVKSAKHTEKKTPVNKYRNDVRTPRSGGICHMANVLEQKSGWRERFAEILATALPDDKLTVRLAYRNLLVTLAGQEFDDELRLKELPEENVAVN